ncbi:hypothetical protein PG999_001594 [Apiospora kogelbergensis]|uniref:F-box domain-containing protein n=1 Tax=Apiospora kogelbergensis TaxID=1337665 RepID=A0AAW0R605_9PEZI
MHQKTNQATGRPLDDPYRFLAKCKPSHLWKAWNHIEGDADETWHKFQADRRRRARPKPPKPEPLWWYKMQQNEVACPLYGLPEELTEAICREMDGSDVFIARQACSLLRRILSAPEFVAPERWTRNPRTTLFLPLGTVSPMVDTPRLAVDWMAVKMCLDRNRCCSDCVEARIPKPDGSDSDFDKTMMRMANKRKYCFACKDDHPLIFFSRNQREVKRGERFRTGPAIKNNRSVCILAESSMKWT